MDRPTGTPVPRPYREREDWEAPIDLRSRAVAGSLCAFLGWLIGSLSGCHSQGMQPLQEPEAAVERLPSGPSPVGSETNSGSDGGLLPLVSSVGVDGFAGGVAPIQQTGPEPKQPVASVSRPLPVPKPRNPALRR